MKKGQVKLAVCLVIILGFLYGTFLVDPGEKELKIRHKRRIDVSNLDEDDQDDVYELWKMGELAKNMLTGYKKLLQREEIMFNPTLRNDLARKYCPNRATQFDCYSYASLHVRSIDGSCNNLVKWWYGKSRTSYKRLIPSHYQDHVGEPRVHSGKHVLPNARRVASVVFKPPLETVSHWNQLMLFFAQFVANDLAQTATSYERVERGVRKRTCKCDSKDDDCLNIQTTRSDTDNHDQRCMTFVRSMPATKSFDCTMGPREQVNLNTHWLDLSQLYGSTHSTARKLRAYTKGLLKSNRDANGEYLPYVKNNSICDLYNKRMTKYAEREACYLTGDSRAEENVILTSMHTIWLRYHNKIATYLSSLNPHWSDERVFQTTRRILIAQYQHIVYSEFLPALIGQPMALKYQLTPNDEGYFKHYNPDIYPHVLNEFATAAFRFGHTLVRNELTTMDKELTYSTPKPLSTYIFNNLYYKKFMNDTIRGAMFDFSYAPMTQTNKYLENRLYEGLFRSDDTVRWSLPALNIQRGRDHGLPGYIYFREWCGLNKGHRFDELDNIPREVLAKLKWTYASTCDIDLFVGLMSERPMRDALVGETAGCIIAKQFRDLKYGDRFYYETSDSRIRFKPKQLDDIRETSFMSSILCETIDVSFAQKYSFYVANLDWNKVVDCRKQPKINLKLWKEKSSSTESIEPEKPEQSGISASSFAAESINSNSQDQVDSSNDNSSNQPDNSASKIASVSDTDSVEASISAFSLVDNDSISDQTSDTSNQTISLSTFALDGPLATRLSILDVSNDDGLSDNLVDSNAEPDTSAQSRISSIDLVEQDSILSNDTESTTEQDSTLTEQDISWNSTQSSELASTAETTEDTMNTTNDHFSEATLDEAVSLNTTDEPTTAYIDSTELVDLTTVSISEVSSTQEASTEQIITSTEEMSTTEEMTSEEDISTVPTTIEDTTTEPEELIVFSSGCSIDSNHSLTCSNANSTESEYIFNSKSLDNLTLTSIDLILSQPDKLLEVNLANISVTHIGRLSVSASNNSHALIQFTGLLNLTIDQIDVENSNASLTIIFTEILYLTVGRMNGDFGDDSLNSITFEQVIHKQFGMINVHSSGETTATVFDARGSQDLSIGTLNVTLFNQSSFIFDGVNSTQARIVNLTSQLADGSVAVFDLTFATKLTIANMFSFSANNQSSVKLDLSYSEQNRINSGQCVADASSSVYFNLKEISNSSLASLSCSISDNSSLNLNATGAIELKIGSLDVTLNQSNVNSELIFQEAVLLAIKNLTISSSGSVQARLDFDRAEGTDIQSKVTLKGSKYPANHYLFVKDYNSVISNSASIIIQTRQVFDMTIGSLKCSLNGHSSISLNSGNSSLFSINAISCSFSDNSSGLFDFSNNSNFSSSEEIELNTGDSSHVTLDLSDGENDSVEIFKCSGNSSSSITFEMNDSTNTSLSLVKCSIGLNSSLDLNFSNSTDLSIQDIQLGDSESDSEIRLNLANAVNSSISSLNITSEDDTSYVIDTRKANYVTISSLDCSLHNKSSILFNSSEAYHVTLGSIDCELSEGSSIELDFSSVETLNAPETLNFKVSNQSSVTFNLTNSVGNTIQSLNPAADSSSSVVLDLNKMNDSNIGSITCNSATNSTVDVSLINSANLNINSINIQASRIDVLDSYANILPYGKQVRDSFSANQNYIALLKLDTSFLFFGIPITSVRVYAIGRCYLYNSYTSRTSKVDFKIYPYKITGLNGLSSKWLTSIYFRKVENASDFAMINEDVRAKSTSGIYTEFNATNAFVITWIQVYNDPQANISQKNEFQLIFAYDRTSGKTFTIFKYVQLDTPNGRSFISIESTDYDFYFTPEPSPTSSNCGIFGQFAYRVDLNSTNDMPITSAFKVISLDLMNSINLSINTVTVTSTNYALAVVNFTDTVYLTLSSVNLLSSHYSITNISFERASRFKTSLISTMSVTQSSTDLSYVSASDFIISGVSLVAMGTSTGYLELANATRGSLGTVVCQADSTSLLSLLDVSSNLIMDANSCFNSTATNIPVTLTP